MPINKVDYYGRVLIDLTSDTISADKLLKGVTAHDKSGNLITGTIPTYTGSYEGESGSNDLDLLLSGQLIELNNERITFLKLYACRSSTKLKVVNLPNVTSTGNYAFQDCNGIEKVSMSSLINVANGLFNGCTALKTVYLPKAQQLLGTSFKNCSSLVKLDFSKATKINTEVFSGCTKLTTLVLRSEALCQLMNINSFTNTPISNGTGTIYVADKLVDTYKSATNWSTYASQIKPLSEYVEE